MGEESNIRLKDTMGATFPKSGELFEGRYRVGPMIGAGGFARVYKAHQEDLGREVALKLLTPGEGGDYDGKLVERFNQEARVVSRLRDPHTITMFDYGRTTSGLLYMVFEYVNGVSLSKLISTQAPLAPERAVKLLRQVLSSLEEAHALGMLHRDIKPGNIMVFEHVGRPDQVKLLDFGIAKMTGTTMKADLTADGALIGTPRYMSPEQIRGDELSAQSDIYSLGLVAYELLMGRKAIESNSSVTIIGQQLDPNSFVLPPMTSVPDGLRRIVNKMMAKDRKQRFNTCTEVLTALENWKEGGIQNLFDQVDSTDVLHEIPYGDFPDISDEVVPMESTQNQRQVGRSNTPVPDRPVHPTGRYGNVLEHQPQRQPTGGHRALTESDISSRGSDISSRGFTDPSSVSKVQPDQQNTNNRSRLLLMGGIGVVVLLMGVMVIAGLMRTDDPPEVAIVEPIAEQPAVVVKEPSEPEDAPKAVARRFQVRTLPADLGVMVNGKQMGLAPVTLDDQSVEFPVKVRVQRGDAMSDVFEFKAFQPELVIDARAFVAGLEAGNSAPIVTQPAESKTKTKVTRTTTKVEKPVEQTKAPDVKTAPAEKTKINLPALD